MRGERAVKIISLRKYRELAAGARSGRDCREACLGFAEALWAELGCELSLEASAGSGQDPEELFATLLGQVRQRQQERERREQQARQEMQQLLEAFNRAVIAVAEGGDRASERFAAVGKVLERASRAESLATMRAVVHEAVETLRRESEAQRIETGAQLEALGRQLEQARARRGGAAGADAGRGREEAVEAMRRMEASGRAAGVAAVVFERLATMEARFGRAVAEEAVGAFERERLAGLALEGRVYAWTPAMRVWLMEADGGAEEVRQRLEEALGEPFEYRTLAAGRRVTLALEGRWMWGLLGPTGAATLIEEVDLFGAGAPVRR
jgi:hypothetical protein